MNNSILGYSFSSNYSNVNGNINTSHEITKMNNDSIVTEKYRNNKLVKVLKTPLKERFVDKKKIKKKGSKKLKGINLGEIIKSKKSQKTPSSSLKKTKLKPKNSSKKTSTPVKIMVKKRRSLTRKRSAKSKGVTGKKTKRTNN